MESKTLVIDFLTYSSIDELPEEDRILLQKAIAASDASYSPYSKFRVGAAVRLSNGRFVVGANQENAAYPSGLCAERTAVFSAHATYPDSDIEAIAVTGVHNGKMLKDPTYPCGACRQVLVESETRARKPIKVIVGGESRIEVFSSVLCLMPFAFDNLI